MFLSIVTIHSTWFGISFPSGDCSHSDMLRYGSHQDWNCCFLLWTFFCLLIWIKSLVRTIASMIRINPSISSRIVLEWLCDTSAIIPWLATLRRTSSIQIREIWSRHISHRFLITFLQCVRFNSTVDLAVLSKVHLMISILVKCLKCSYSASRYWITNHLISSLLKNVSVSLFLQGV